MTEIVNSICDCNDLTCDLRVTISREEATKLTQDSHRIIVDGCKTGPSCGYTLLKDCRGYDVYEQE